jgi:AcrR family transcriptional regulator
VTNTGFSIVNAVIILPQKKSVELNLHAPQTKGADTRLFYFHETTSFIKINLYLKIFLVKFREMMCITNIMKRSYQLKRRAETQGRTRQKIIDAAIELHQKKGLAATKISDIAARAKVGKVTVYRHFPDEAALVGACSGRYFQRHPLPDIEDWRRIQDASERLRQGLRDTYSYHGTTEPMMTRILAEARDHPVMVPYHAHWRRAVDVLAAAWPTSALGKASLKAALALALGFDTWHLLVRTRRLTDDQAIELMTRLMCDCPGRANATAD